MIDLPLMAKLVEAVPDGARLVLLGDPDQLPSVEAGDVLSGILAAADNVSDGGSTSPASGRGRAKGAGEGALRSVENTPPPAGAPPAFPAHHIHLTRSYRHSATSEEHTSELQSLMRISYAVFCISKQPTLHTHTT